GQLPGQFPASFANAQAVGQHLPCQGKEERKRVVGYLVNAVIGHITNGNTACSGRFQVDVIDANAIAGDGSHGSHGGNNVGVDRCELSDDRVGLSDEPRQLPGVHAAPASKEFTAEWLEDVGLDVQCVKRVVGHRHAVHAPNLREKPDVRL